MKLSEAILHPISAGYFTPEEVAGRGLRLCIGKTRWNESILDLYLLVEESDGLIADAKYQAFGPPHLIAAAESACHLLLGKTYVQAQRFSAELIERQLHPEYLNPSFLNLLLEAIEKACFLCMDIPIDDTLMTPEALNQNQASQEYPNWQQLNAEDHKRVIAQLIATDIRPYVALDAGGVEVLEVRHPEVRIAYQGSCTSCHSATGATLDAIQNILRIKIHPHLIVIPDSSFLNPVQ